MDWLQTVIIAIVEGLTEFLPVSSTGHMIIAQSVLGIESTPFVKAFTVIIQFGAILSVVVLYWRKFFYPETMRTKGYTWWQAIWRFYLKLIAGVLPAVVLGLAFNDFIESNLGNVTLVAVMLILGGIFMLFCDRIFNKGTFNEPSYKKAFIIGICASAPIGPIAILVIQRSLSQGHKAGFVAGLGACLVDTVFSIIAIFALAFAQKIIEENQELILLAGGLVVAVMGWRMAVSNPFRKVKAETESTYVSIKDFFQAMAMGFSNPGAIFVIFALFAFFGIGSSSPHDWKVAPIIVSVSAGAAAYWFCVTALLDHFRKKFRLETIMWINRIAGAIIVIIGLSLIGEGLFRVIFQGKPLL